MKYPDDYINKIICGDCLEVMKGISNKSIDTILTDVPYNLGDTDSEVIKFKDRAIMNRATSDSWNKGFNPISFLLESKRILKKEGNIFIYTCHRHFGDYFKWLDENFDRVFFLVWHKTNPEPSVRKVAWLSANGLWANAWDVGHTFNFSNMKDMHNYIECAATPASVRRVAEDGTTHIAQKPAPVWLKQVLALSDVVDLVLDPYAGVGSCGVVAVQNGRRYIGIENDPKWFNTMVNWFTEEFGESVDASD